MTTYSSVKSPTPVIEIYSKEHVETLNIETLILKRNVPRTYFPTCKARLSFCSCLHSERLEASIYLIQNFLLRDNYLNKSFCSFNICRM